MPETWRENRFNGKPTFEVLTGFDRRTGEPFWRGFQLATAQAIIENFDALKRWVEKQRGNQK